MNVEQFAGLIAEVLMPGAPHFVVEPALKLARAILEQHAVVKLQPASFEDENGTTWNACDGYELAKVAHGVLLIGDDPLEPHEAEETAGALLAAARLARADAAEVPVR